MLIFLFRPEFVEKRRNASPSAMLVSLLVLVVLKLGMS